MTRPPVVVVGLDCPTGLQTARVFAERGIEVIGIAHDPGHPCARTRRCRQVVVADAGPEGIVRALRRLARERHRRAVLVPCTDQAVLAIVRHRDELSADYLFSLPSAEVVERLLDKSRFFELARTFDIPVPETRSVRSRRELLAAAWAVGFPCVLKPAVKTAAWDAEAPAKAFILQSRRALLDTYDRWGRHAEAFVLQEWVEGADPDHYTCDCVLDADGKPLVTFTSRKLRQWPPVVGQACLSVEHDDPRVRDLALRTLAAAGHRGQGYIECKWDARRGRHVVLEANVGRPTGRSATAERAGVELLMTLYNDVTGLPLPVERVQRFRGTKWIHFRRDVQACVKMLAERRITPGEVVRSWTGSFACALWSPRDPLPFLADAVGTAWGVLRRERSLAVVRPAPTAEEVPERIPAAALQVASPSGANGGPAPPRTLRAEQPRRGGNRGPMFALTPAAGLLSAQLAELAASLRQTLT